VRRFSLPEEEDRKEQYSNDKRQKDVNLYPTLLSSRIVLVGERERHQKTPECSYDQDNADDVELPEERDRELYRTKHLIGRAVT
jgi:hypothetical protein